MDEKLQIIEQVPMLKKLKNYGQSGLNRKISGTEVQKLIAGYKGVKEFLPGNDQDAILEPFGSRRVPLSHKRLKEFVSTFDLAQFGIPVRSRVGVLLPNGAELAVALVCLVSYWCAAPINLTNTWEEMKMELESAKCSAIMIMQGATGNENAIKAAEALNLTVISITQTGFVTGLFHMSLVTPLHEENVQVIEPHLEDIHHAGPKQTVLLLHTSGTSGTKKLVPYTLETLLVGVGCIVSSWALVPSDVCLNMMPLFHIGGIVRNVFSPLLSGGSIIACGGFDPLLFWDTLVAHRVTWYYASPTMHHAILNEAANRPLPLPVGEMRYVANAAGGLLPMLAVMLKNTFDQAVILTSYGMTECMPISSPPLDYRLSPSGTSGISCGPEILIVDDALMPMGNGLKGNILIRGPPCFAGYEGNDASNQESFFTIKGHGAGWFNTGDLGGLDEQGYLFISGRTKEVINRGGETISPFEIEEACQGHPYIKEVLCFSAPNAQYQESIGVVIVKQNNKPRVDLNTLHAYLENRLHRSKWPQVIIFSDKGLPKNATGKILRIKFAERTNISSIDEESPPHTRLYEMTCPDVGTPLSVPIPLTRVKRDLYKTFTHLLTQDCVVDVAVLLVPLGQYQSAVVAFVVLANNKGRPETLRDGCVLALDQYEVPQFIYGVTEIPYLPAENSANWAKLSEVEQSKDGFVRRNSFDSTVMGDESLSGSVYDDNSAPNSPKKGKRHSLSAYSNNNSNNNSFNIGQLKDSNMHNTSMYSLASAASGNTNLNNSSMYSLNSVSSAAPSPRADASTISNTKNNANSNSMYSMTSVASVPNNNKSGTPSPLPSPQLTGSTTSSPGKSPRGNKPPIGKSPRFSTGSVFFPNTSTNNMSTKSMKSSKSTSSKPKNRDITLLVDETKLTALALKLHLEQNIVQPRNAIEAQIEYTWRAVLDLKGSGVGTGSVLSVTTSFFDMGGDSLKAGQLVNVMRKELQCHITVADLFTAPTIEKMAYKVAKLKCLGTPDISSISRSTPFRRADDTEHLNEDRRSKRQAKQNSRARSNSVATARTSKTNQKGENSSIWGDASSPLKLSKPSYGAVDDESAGLLQGDINDDKNSDTDSTASTQSFIDPLFSWAFAPENSNLSFGCLFVQALPVVLIFPLRRIVIWFLIAVPWVYLMECGWGRFNALLAAMVFSRLMLGFGAPLTGILAKWIIIYRYQAGRYPLWGNYYLRWWLVEQIVNIMGKGFFRDDIPIIGPSMVRWYYEMMGMRIGDNVSIHKDAKLGQVDLLHLEDNVAIDNCTIRPFSIEEGHFVLLPITIKKNSCVGLKSVVHAGTTVAANTYIGPLSSTHETTTSTTGGSSDTTALYTRPSHNNSGLSVSSIVDPNNIHALSPPPPPADSVYHNHNDPNNRRYCRPTYAPPSTFLILCVGVPIIVLITVISSIPWFFVLRLMVFNAKYLGWYKVNIHSVYRAFLWWITPERLFYFFLLRIVKRCVVPFVKLGLIILLKRNFIGEFKEMTAAEKQTDWNRFRYWIMSKLLPGGKLCGVTTLVGTHYEMVSIIYRLLGAKIGQHVYWPGSGLEIVEFDLLTVGDDVVFGSRSVVITSSTTCSKRVTLESGCMIADRCVILPGVTVKKGAVLGSGSLAQEDSVVHIGSVWVGSQDGKAVMVAPEDLSYATKDTVTPFGRAFYLGQAAYTVIPLWGIVLYNTLWQAFCTCYRNCYTPLSLIMCSYILRFDPFDERSPYQMFQCTLLAFMPLHLTLCFAALVIDICGKWVLLGERKQGEYPWDQSSYCQRWQMYLTLQEIRRAERHKTGILDMIQGSQYLVWYFRALGATIGHNVCLYPNGGDPMMTEPDLVTIEDFVGVDDASLIAHINTRGIFRLNPLFVGTGSVLKCNTRLLSGSSMDAHSILLEHTLVMAGEVVDCGSVWQGWPSKSQISLTKYRAQVADKLGFVSRLYLASLGGLRSAVSTSAIHYYADKSSEYGDVLGVADGGDGPSKQLLQKEEGSSEEDDTGLPLSTDDGVQLSDIHGTGGVTKTDVADLEGSVMNDYIDVHGEMMSLLDDAGGDNDNNKNNNNGRANGAGRGSVTGSVQGDAGGRRSVPARLSFGGSIKEGSIIGGK